LVAVKSKKEGEKDSRGEKEKSPSSRDCAIESRISESIRVSESFWSCIAAVACADTTEEEFFEVVELFLEGLFKGLPGIFAFSPEIPVIVLYPLR
jgi:hypothetical protein